eukprot:687784-Pyramimonas_sp.AAC.1
MASEGPALHCVDACPEARHYSAETPASAHNLHDFYLTAAALHELKTGPPTLVAYSTEGKRLEFGGLSMKAVLTIDAESVFKSLSSKDLPEETDRMHPAWAHPLDKIDVPRYIS